MQATIQTVLSMLNGPSKTWVPDGFQSLGGHLCALLQSHPLPLAAGSLRNVSSGHSGEGIRVSLEQTGERRGADKGAAPGA